MPHNNAGHWIAGQPSAFVWTEELFEKITGSKPEQDDLDRVNCQEAGTLLHTCCGVCQHGWPAFMVCKHCRANTEKV